MSDIFFPLFNVEVVADASQFAMPRALAMHNACVRHRDFEVIQMLRQKNGALECVIVDVECDEVPPNNPYGIKYRERLALCVSANRSALVEVLALRKNFPVLMHQNSVNFDSPPSLCLYFEPVDSILRTWTPENFLRRIQWWLEKSARGELHPTDQPVEQLFFVTKYELVMPWNYDELKKISGQRFIVAKGQTRKDNGETFFLNPIAQASPTGGIALIDISLSPVIHGHIEREPTKLSELAALLERRGVNLLATLKGQVSLLVGDDGVSEDVDESLTVILLQIPICRSAGTLPEKIVTKAFMLMTGALKLGVKLGALINHNHRYYKDALSVLATSQETWRDEQLFPLEVLRSLDPASARLKSGIVDDGPQGVIVGVGSLGSIMLELWGRSGWGKWTAIDKDHIKPHNLSRHIAFYQHIGTPKTDVVAALHAAVMNGASEIVSVCADATSLNEDTFNILCAAKLVVDASTTLEYPRIASSQAKFGRHMSVFVTPNGNAAVLLAEDESRSIRLRTLEAQYYRAAIHESWGERHLDGNLGSFWSGGSCRDISTVLAYSRIVAHAATLAEQVQLAQSRSEALIRIWFRDPESGNVNAYRVPVHDERHLRFDDLDFFIDDGLEQKLRVQRRQKAPCETGGVLLGYYDFNINAVIVVDALPEPSDSESTTVSFKRGVENLPELVAEASRRTAGIVQYIGEWHSHPPGHSSTPSQDDMYQLDYLSIGMAQDGLPAVSLIIGEHDIQVMKGVVKE